MEVFHNYYLGETLLSRDLKYAIKINLETVSLLWAGRYYSKTQGVLKAFILYPHTRPSVTL